MRESNTVLMTTDSPLNRRWIGPAYAAFAAALLVMATMTNVDAVVLVPPALALLLVLLLAALLTGALIVHGRSGRFHGLALPLLLVDAGAAFGLIALTGGYRSPLWVALLVVSTAAPLLLPNRWSIALLGGVWLLDGAFLLQAPADAVAEPLLQWALRASGVLLIGLLVQRALAGEEAQRLRAQRRERVLREFLALSNKLRVTNQPQAILEEVARAVQASGEYDCVTLSRVDWDAGNATVQVAFGASGRRLRAVEGLEFGWDAIAPLLNDARRAGPGTFRSTTLPFRSIRDEQHLILPLNSQFAEVRGLLTVSYPRAGEPRLGETLPLLELLANQAAAALDNSALYGTLEERVLAATAEAERGRQELAVARDRAETLFQITRALSGSLDEREVLTLGLGLVVQATGAERGGVMLVEPNTGRLAFRTSLDMARGGAASGLERGQELAGWVLANRAPARLDDARADPRWQNRASEASCRAVIAVPLLLDEEALGVLLLAHSVPQRFGEGQESLALTVASQIAVALSKAQLYRYVSEQSERLGITLQQREEEISKVQAILRSIGDGVVVSDRLGRVRLINPAAVEMLGIAPESFAGRQLSELPGAPHGTRTAGETQQVRVGERTLRADHAPVQSALGEWLGSVIIYRDITREALADRLKSEFIATASHELRTPLTSVRGYVDLLLLGTLGPLSAPQMDFLKVVKTNIIRLVELLDDLLDVSKAEAGEVRLRREEVDLAEIIHEVGETLYSQFSERAISLAIDVQPSLPRVVADRQRLRQIVTNLVSNACKYTPTGGHVDVVARNGGGDLRVDVRDTGVGITAAAQPFIFTPFFRADNPLREIAGGTGLGLSITKTLVDLHGGKIWFESHEGQGTTFSFTLPVGGVEWKPAAWLEHTR